MSDTDLNRAVSESVAEVLEKMFFISATEETGPPEEPRGPEIMVRLAFEGEPCGTLVLKIPVAAALPIAADFLAEDEQSLSDGQVSGVICELANMVCGSVLSRVESESAFRLAHPVVVPSEEPLDTEGSVVQRFNVGTESLLVYFKTEAACSTGKSAY